MAVGIRMVDWPVVYTLFKDTYERMDELHAVEFEQFARSFADVLEAANGKRFKRNMFLQACGFTPDGDIEELRPATLERYGQYSTDVLKG